MYPYNSRFLERSLALRYGEASNILSKKHPVQDSFIRFRVKLVFTRFVSFSRFHTYGSALRNLFG